MAKLREGASIAPRFQEELKPIRLSKEKKALIQQQTKAKLSALAALPPPPYTVITPAPKLAEKSPAELCNYVADKFPRIDAVPAYASCNPSVASVTLIYEALFPLAGIGKDDIVSSQKVSLELFDTQLRQNFTAMIISCANLSNGDASLFALTGVATKKSPEKHNGKLPAPEFTLKVNKGSGRIFIRTKKMLYAKKYRVYFGPGDVYTKETWNFIEGGCYQTLVNLTPGSNVSIIVVAIGKDGEGDWSNVQSRIVPHN